MQFAKTKNDKKRKDSIKNDKKHNLEQKNKRYNFYVDVTKSYPFWTLWPILDGKINTSNFKKKPGKAKWLLVTP